MIHSKIIQEPEFRKLPSTDAANVKENIDNWLDNNKQDEINTFLTKEPHEYRSFYRGYRFITYEDLEEETIANQIILGINVIITFYRKVCTPDHLCPLYFREDYNRSHVTIELPNGEQFKFKSDNNLKVKIKEFKND